MTDQTLSLASHNFVVVFKSGKGNGMERNGMDFVFEGQAFHLSQTSSRMSFAVDSDDPTSASSQLGAMDGSLNRNLLFQEQSAMDHLASVPNMHGGLSSNGQLPATNRSTNNPIPTEQAVTPPCSVLPDPGGISVGASQHQNLENKCETGQSTANSLASFADNAKEAGSKPQSEYIKAQVRLNDYPIPSSGSDMMLITVPQFVVEVPRSMPFACWKDEILKKMAAEIDNIGNIEIPIARKVTIGQKRATQTYPILRDNFEEHKRNKVQGATENYFSYDTKTNIVQQPHDSKDILPPGNKKSTNALLGEIPIDRSISQVEAVDSVHQISQPSQHGKPKFSMDEIKLLIEAADKLGAGAWREIKQKFFHASARTCNELKEKWRSLVQTANNPPEKRRGLFHPDAPEKDGREKLLERVRSISRRAQQQRKKPPQHGT